MVEGRRDWRVKASEWKWKAVKGAVRNAKRGCGYAGGVAYCREGKTF